jgi:RNA polymerase sigma factor (sigma-70 family)
MPDSGPLSWLEGPAAFAPGYRTDWGLVQAASQSSPVGTEALERLCRTYWYPLYAYVRRKGYEPADAQDLTQEFFARLLETPWMEGVHPAKGKFRSFLLASMNHFLAKEWRRGQAQKRGGGEVVFSLDAVAAEDRYRFEPSHDETPDKVFEHHWARTMIERALGQLREEKFASAQSELFEGLKERLTGETKSHSYAEMAARLGMTEPAVKKAAQRLREHFQKLLRTEVARTVSDAREVDEEMRSLLAAVHR